MKSVRQTAYEILLNIHKNQAYSNISVDSAIETGKLNETDASFLSALVYGTIEKTIGLDYNLALYLTQPINKLRPEILTVLRLGAYQLLFMSRIPVSAAVNESVKIIKNTKLSFAAGMVNAVLRKVSIIGFILPSVDCYMEYLSVKYSFPVWLIRLWANSYGMENTIGVLEHSLTRAPAYARVNVLRISSDELTSVLYKEGIESESHKDYCNTITIKKRGSIETIDSFRDGLFHIQDLSSQLFCSALGAKVGDVVIDLCAAPGGKSFTLAQQVGETGKVFAFDIYESRLELIRQGARRLKLKNIYTSIGDASVFDQKLGFADIVVCDVPCSGLGVIRRKPEIRFKEAANIDKLPELQYFILCNASRYVKLDGLLAYSTCTLNPKENEEVCNRFLQKYSDCFTLCKSNIVNGIMGEKYTTLLPHINNSDGFFFALFKRTG